MEEKRVSFESDVIDKLLDGGLETGIITTVYGPGGSGKTCLCMLAMIACDKKIIYVDTESNFSIARLKQLTSDYDAVLKKTVFIHPNTIEEQKKAIEGLKDVDIGIIIVDSIATPYRIELAGSLEKQLVNKELGYQLSVLGDIARTKKIPVLMTDQVYSDFEKPGQVKLVGGDLINYSSKCLIELKKFLNNRRTATVKRHRSLPEGKIAMFEIVEKGFLEVKE